LTYDPIRQPASRNRGVPVHYAYRGGCKEVDTMNKVWIVQQGEYSDTCIAGAFTDQAIAEEFADACGGYSSELDLDVPFERRPKGTCWYYVFMNRDGNTRKVKREDYFPDPSNIFVMHDDGFHLHGCFARDEQHAVKIANDRRRQMIAEGKL
jgi:hypothetical protein